MKSKKTRLLILVTFILSLFISLGGFFVSRIKQDIEIIYEKPMQPIAKEKFIEWPIINSSVLDQSIVGYDGEINEEIFKKAFNKEFDSKYKGDKDIKFPKKEYEFEDNIVKVKVSSNAKPSEYVNSQKTYYYKLRKNL